MKEFVHLHVHTEFSMLDGAIRLKDLFKHCDQLGMSAVAITDHGNMYAALEFMKAAVKFTEEYADPYDFIAKKKPFKVKPIIGCEMYMTQDIRVKNSSTKHSNHIVLLAKNETGYKNLIKLSSISFIDGMYYKPRIDFSTLKQHSEGLICLSACLAGIIPQCLLAGDVQGADQWAKDFKQVFGDDFYIEVQNHRLVAQIRIIPLLVKIATDNNIKLVATNDAHYLKKEDALMQKVLQNISFQRTMSPDEQFSDGIVENESDYFPTDEFYIKSGEEMSQLFGHIEGAIENTVEIANKCSCDFFRKEKLLPSFVPPDGKTPYEYLREMTFSGIEKKYGEVSEKNRERAEYELKIISELGFVEYFLIVWDFINYAEKNNVSVGPGRGSGVGSIVAYAIGITKVDPIKYSLFFERFLNPERVSNPDFDIDFCVEGRPKVIEYVRKKYGEANVSQIITFSTLAAKAAIKDVGRVFDRPFAEINNLTAKIPKIMGKNKISNVLGFKPPKDSDPMVFVPELKEIYNSDAGAKRIIDMAMKIEGMPRQTGMHAAGVIICKDEIACHIPLAKSVDDDVTTQFNMLECEELGLLKMDFFGLTTLTDISKAKEYIRQTRGIDIDFYGMSYDDPEVFKLISEGDTSAVFQLESGGMTNFMKNLRPTSLEDVIAGIALFRPGPMEYIGQYIAGKKEPEKVVYDHPRLEPILKLTHGVMVYQEQVMDAVRALAGYSFGRADIVRRIMSKKKSDAMEKEKKVFLYGTPDGKVKGCINNGVEEEAAKIVFEKMTKFAAYAFNKSHAAAYAYLAYQTAYLKRYYAVEFITAVLNNRIDKIDEITNYMTYLKQKGIPILPPDINKSLADFSVENGSVRIGLAALKSVGKALISLVISEREKGLFASFEDFAKRMQQSTQSENKGSIGKKLLETLIFAGAFDSFGQTRSQLISSYEIILDRAKKEYSASLSGQLSFFDCAMEDKFVYPDVREYSTTFRLQKEKEVAGIYLTGHPLEAYSEKLKEFSQNTSMLKPKEGEASPDYITLGGMLIDAKVKFTKMGKEIGVGVIEDLYGSAEVLVGAEKLKKIREYWQKDSLVTISGKVNSNDDKFTLWVDKLALWQVSETRRKKMCMYFESENDFLAAEKGIREVLAEYSGDDEVYVSFYSKGRKVVSIMPQITAFACEMLKNELFGCGDILDIKIC